nr:MAG TPA: hypothetical protein [Caudoviricetes sp.]
MANWSNSTNWNSTAYRGQVRYEEFKQDHPRAVFLFNGTRVLVNDTKTWEHAKELLGAKRGTNPFTASVQVLINDTPVQFNKIERPRGRKSGQAAENMEALVAVATLVDVANYREFSDLINDPKNLESLVKRCQGVSRDQVYKIIDAVADDESYGDTFIRIGKNIRTGTPIKGNIDDYVVINKQVWDKLKAKAAALLSLDYGKVQGDKWNPADLLFVRKSFDFGHFQVEGNIAEFNEKFNSLVKQGEIIPVSVKQKVDSIKGSRGIATEIPTDISNISIRAIANKGSIAGIPVKLSYEYGKTTDDATIQKRALGWIESKGKEHVEQTVALAAGLIPDSSIWYLANDQYVQEHFEDAKRPPKIQEVIISLNSKAIWLKFDNTFAIVRTKGGNIQVSIEKERVNAKFVAPDEVDPSDFKLLESDKLQEIEAQLLSEYTLVESL